MDESLISHIEERVKLEREQNMKTTPFLSPFFSLIYLVGRLEDRKW